MQERNRPVTEIMQRRHAVTLPPHGTVREACRLMHDDRIGAIVITDEAQKLVGIFTAAMRFRACWPRGATRRPPRSPR